MYVFPFTVTYARCVATRSVMIPKTEVLAYRQLMIQELHQKSLCPIPPTIQPGEYYAVDHVKTYYFGRVMKKSGSFVEFKFLHRNSATTFHWSRRDDVDTVHFSNIFSDPVTVPQFISGPFEILELPEVEKLFKVIRKHKKVWKTIRRNNCLTIISWSIRPSYISRYVVDKW